MYQQTRQQSSHPSSARELTNALNQPLWSANSRRLGKSPSHPTILRTFQIVVSKQQTQKTRKKQQQPIPSYPHPSQSPKQTPIIQSQAPTNLTPNAIDNGKRGHAQESPRVVRPPGCRAARHKSGVVLRGLAAQGNRQEGGRHRYPAGILLLRTPPGRCPGGQRLTISAAWSE